MAKLSRITEEVRATLTESSAMFYAGGFPSSARHWSALACSRRARIRPRLSRSPSRTSRGPYLAVSSSSPSREPGPEDAGSVLLGLLIWKEVLGPLLLFGIALIVVGVVVLNVAPDASRA